MRKLVSLFLCALLIAALAIPAAAAANTVTIESPEEAKAGEAFTLTLHADALESYAFGVLLEIPDGLTVGADAVKNTVSAENGGYPITYTGEGEVGVGHWFIDPETQGSETQKTTYTGDFGTITLTAAEAGTYTISGDLSYYTDAGVQTATVSLEVVVGESDALAGDMNGDGEVTDADAIYLLWHTFYPEDFPVTGNVDVNGDGEVTDADAIYLLWHTFYPEDFPL